MLSTRLGELFRLLQCSNSEIARFAGCSASHISRLKSGQRTPKPASQTVLRLAEGIYRYADYENLLSVLGELCGLQETDADRMIPAVIAWLYQEQDFRLPPSLTPKSKRNRQDRLQRFGQRLDKTMTLLDYSNGRLASDLNVDASLISRYRSGLYHPNRNLQIRSRLSELLLARAERTNRTQALAALCGAAQNALSPELLGEWLYGEEDAPSYEIVDSLFRSMDAGASEGLPLFSPDRMPAAPEAERYWGSEGLQQAVIRFLADTAREGGELLLYSDEPMEWLSEDRSFFALWANLMTACVHGGVRIRIIHNVDRNGLEMVSAIRGWFPLYLSCRIEPYVFQKPRNSRFHHTIFLRPGHAGISGFSPAGAGNRRWYDYVTDPARLESLEAGFLSMLSGSSPFLKTYPAREADVFWIRYHTCSGRVNALLRGLSISSMPEELLDRILRGSRLPDPDQKQIVSFYQQSRQHFLRILEAGELHEILCLPEPAAVRSGSVVLNAEAETGGLRLTYTPEEYAEHLAAVARLVSGSKGYHLTLLREAPFRDLQVFTTRDAVGVVHCRPPYTTFVFLNADLVRSVADYCDSLTADNEAERSSVLDALEQMIRSCRRDEETLADCSADAYFREG